MYEGIEDNCNNSEWLENRCILCPHNGSTSKMNDHVIDLLQGEENIFIVQTQQTNMMNMETYQLNF